MLLVLSCSLNPNSRSRILAKRANEQLLAAGQKTRFVNLADYQLPLCNASDCYTSDSVIQLQTWIQEAHGILIATPVYNYDASHRINWKSLVRESGRIPLCRRRKRQLYVPHGTCQQLDARLPLPHNSPLRLCNERSFP